MLYEVTKFDPTKGPIQRIQLHFELGPINPNPRQFELGETPFSESNLAHLSPQDVEKIYDLKDRPDI